MENNPKLKKEEIILVGSWKMSGDKVVADEICKRIEILVDTYLRKVAIDKTGWEMLYQDPNDNRYWLLTYPNSDWQNGGPPTLKVITQIEMAEKVDVLSQNHRWKDSSLQFILRKSAQISFWLALISTLFLLLGYFQTRNQLVQPLIPKSVINYLSNPYLFSFFILIPVCIIDFILLIKSKNIAVIIISILIIVLHPVLLAIYLP